MCEHQLGRVVYPPGAPFGKPVCKHPSWLRFATQPIVGFLRKTGAAHQCAQVTPQPSLVACLCLHTSFVALRATCLTKTLPQLAQLGSPLTHECWPPARRGSQGGSRSTGCAQHPPVCLYTVQHPVRALCSRTSVQEGGRCGGRPAHPGSILRPGVRRLLCHRVRGYAAPGRGASYAAWGAAVLCDSRPSRRPPRPTGRLVIAHKSLAQVARSRPSRAIDCSRLLAHKCASRSRRAQPRASVRPGSASPSRAQVCEHFSGTPLVLAHCTLALRALFIIVNGRHKTKDKLTESRMSRKIHVRFGEWIVVFVKKDCCSTLLIREATFEGHHTRAVQIGLRYGMILFIASEVMFFLAFFWAFFHSSLAPTVEIGAVWPPKGIQVLSPWEVPFLNTLILLSSGAAVTWAHHAILAGYRKQAIYSLCVTIVLAILFTGFQCYEYLSAPFTLSSGRATVSSITITRS